MNSSTFSHVVIYLCKNLNIEITKAQEKSNGFSKLIIIERSETKGHMNLLSTYFLQLRFKSFCN